MLNWCIVGPEIWVLLWKWHVFFCTRETVELCNEILEDEERKYMNEKGFYIPEETLYYCGNGTSSTWKVEYYLWFSSRRWKVWSCVKGNLNVGGLQCEVICCIQNRYIQFFPSKELTWIKLLFTKALGNDNADIIVLVAISSTQIWTREQESDMASLRRYCKIYEIRRKASFAL